MLRRLKTAILWVGCAFELSAAHNRADPSSADDSYINAKAAQELGWTTAHLVEPEEPTPKEQAAQYEIRTLQSLRDIWPEFFKSMNAPH